MEDSGPNQFALVPPPVPPEQRRGQLAAAQAITRVPGVALPASAAPAVGVHDAAPLAEAGFSAAQIAKQRERGLIGPV
jgi:hypothetical protein